MSKRAEVTGAAPEERPKKTAIAHDLPPGEKPTSPIVPLALVAVPILALVVYAIVT